jgi:hypothetical protein
MNMLPSQMPDHSRRHNLIYVLVKNQTDFTHDTNCSFWVKFKILVSFHPSFFSA